MGFNADLVERGKPQLAVVCAAGSLCGGLEVVGAAGQGPHASLLLHAAGLPGAIAGFRVRSRVTAIARQIGWNGPKSYRAFRRHGSCAKPQLTLV